MAYFFNVIGIFIAIFAVVYSYFKWTYQYWKSRNVPGFEPTIPYGNIPTDISFPNYLKKIYKTAKIKGWKYMGLYAALTKTLVVVDLDLLKLIMTKDFKHFMDRLIYTNEKGEPLTSNLATVDGEKWRTLRPKLSPTFTSGKLKQMFLTIASSGEKLESYISEHEKKKEPVEIQRTLEKFGIDIIGTCAFGIECNAFTDPNCPFVSYTMKHLNKSAWANTKIKFARRFPQLFKYTGLKLIDESVTKFYNDLVRDTMNHRLTNNITRNDFMQLLIDMREDSNSAKAGGTQLSFDEIVSQCFLFFNAGFQTTSSTLTFAIYELTQRLDLQDKLREEIHRVLAKHDNKITYDCLNEMDYMEQVIKEALRLHNPIQINARGCNEDYAVPGTDLVIEKGIRITIPTLAIHHDDDIYPDPLKFDPDRFNEENSRNRHQYAFIPFGEGPRVCIGARFAMMEAKVGLTSILRNYKVTLSERTELPVKKSTSQATVQRFGQDMWIDLERI